MASPCTFEAFMKSAGPFVGSAVGVIRCATHDYEMPPGGTLNSGAICPIGRIQIETDEAIKKIKAAIP